MKANGGKVNIKTISEITGFSPATISNALNAKRGVKKETSSIIIDTAKSLGYIPDTDLSMVRFVIYRRPGSIITDNPFFSKVVSGAEEVCEAHGFEITVTYLDMRLSSYRDDLQAILDDKTAGIVLMGSELEEDELVHFKNAGLPVIVLDYWCEDMEIECILNNGLESTKKMIEYLLAKGHTKIGYLQGHIRSYPFREREKALRETLAKHGYPLQDKYIFPVMLSMDGSYLSMKEHMAEKREMPTALFADNDVMALGAMRAMREAGFRLPQDVSVAAYDDIPMGEITAPRLTTIHPEMEWLGRAAAQKVVDTAKDPCRPKSKVIVAPRFIERDSVRDLNED